jgi:hypothetical protein
MFESLKSDVEETKEDSTKVEKYIRHSDKQRNDHYRLCPRENVYDNIQQLKQMIEKKYI